MENETDKARQIIEKNVLKKKLEDAKVLGLFADGVLYEALHLTSDGEYILLYNDESGHMNSKTYEKKEAERWLIDRGIKKEKQ